MFAVINNPAAGGGKNAALIDRIEEMIKAHGETCRIYRTSVEGDAAQCARQAIQEGCTSVVCMGGDGTLGETAGELCGKPVDFYIVPNGTGNDFARVFGLDKDPLTAFQEQLDGLPIAIDCGRVNDRFFLNVAGSGFDVEVLRKTEELKAVYPGEKAYHKAVVSVLERYQAFEADLTLDDGKITHERVTIIEIANGQYIGGGMRVAPDAMLVDGYFLVVVVKMVPRVLIPLLLPLFVMGLHTKLPLARVVKARKVNMRAPGMVVNLDGLLVKMDEARFEILPGALHVRRPRKPARGLRDLKENNA